LECNFEQKTVLNLQKISRFRFKNERIKNNFKAIF